MAELKAFDAVLATVPIQGVPMPMLVVNCPNCQGSFLVGPKRWVKAPETTRPCPYCFKCSEVPNGD